MGIAVFVGFVLIAIAVLVGVLWVAMSSGLAGLSHLARLGARRWLLLAYPDEVVDPAGGAPLGKGLAGSFSLAARQRLHCWEMKQCPPARRESCPAFHRPDTPCWLVNLDAGDGARLRAECLTCRAFDLTALMTHS